MGLQDLIKKQTASAPAANQTPPPATPATPVAAPTPATAATPPASVTALGGGNRLSAVRDALRTAKVSNRRNDLPLGTGVYLLKSGKFKVTDDGKYKMSIFSLLCLSATTDSNGITVGTEGYTGPVPNETYELAVFQDFGAKYLKKTMDNNLSIVRACLGWDAAKVTAFQSTDEGLNTLEQIIEGLLCMSMQTLAGTGQECIFANQVVVQITSKVTTKNTETFDKDGNPIMKSYTNTYWDKKVPLADLPALIGDEAVIAAFGSEDAFVAAAGNEQAMLDM